jgi:hypothetical protein
MEKKKIPSKTRVFISLILGCTFLIVGFVASFNEPWGNTTHEIRQVEDAINKEFSLEDSEMWRPKSAVLVLDLKQWGKIKKITSPLVYENERIARAKALLHFGNNSVPSLFFDESIWESRSEISKQEWIIQSFSSRILTSMGIAASIFFASTIISYLVLIIVPFLWYFLLSRISELSQAVRGK